MDLEYKAHLLKSTNTFFCTIKTQSRNGRERREEQFSCKSQTLGGDDVSHYHISSGVLGRSQIMNLLQNSDLS